MENNQKENMNQTKSDLYGNQTKSLCGIPETL